MLLLLIFSSLRFGNVLLFIKSHDLRFVLDNDKFVPGCVIGKSLENLNTTTISTIEVVVGRF